MPSRLKAKRPTSPGGAATFKIATALDIYAEDHAPQTADPARIAYCIKALLPYWQGKTVANITRATCQGYVRHRKGLKTSTVRRELSCLQAAVNHSHKDGVLLETRPVTLPPKPPQGGTVLTRQEAAALIRAARQSNQAKHLPLFILIGLYTGARSQSAILPLQWLPSTTGGHVDLERERIYFNAVGRPQTDKKRVVIPINGRLLRFLIYARRRTKQFVLEHRGGRVQSIKTGFGNAKELAASVMEKRGRKESAARLRAFTPHHLRHTCCTWLMWDDVPTAKAARYVGMDEKTFEKVYAHHSPSFLKDVAAALD